MGSIDIKAISKDLIRNAVSQYLTKYEQKTSSPLDYIFLKERRIRSIIGGLETSFGTRVWEPLATALAEKNGFVIKDKKTFNNSVPVIPESIFHQLTDFEERKKQDASLKHQDYFSEICKFICEQHVKVTKKRKIQKGSGVDLWLSKNGFEYLIDIKTVQINAGSGVKFNRNLLEWYTYMALEKFSNVNCWIAFPYNPHSENYWKKESGKVEPLLPSVEAKVESEFWDALSGQTGTYIEIEKAFKELSSDGLKKEFQHLF